MQGDFKKDDHFKALYVGQIQEEKQEDFKSLMKSLSKAYDPKDVDGRTCIIYDYYNRDNPVITTSTNEHILNEIIPPKWADTWASEKENKKKCIEIIDHMLNLSGFAQYLNNEVNKLELTKNHDICCCITYYNNRAGDVKLHQDSLGAELFVSLIYRDPVYGPELKLKEEHQFNERINQIKGMMPECFIVKLKELYQDIEDEENGLVEIKEKKFGLHPDLIEWPGRLEGPGGIVAWVDELMIHTTPYMYHRQPNDNLLLNILEEMKGSWFDWEDEDQEIQPLKHLRTVIQKIVEEKGSHYITIYELKDKIGDEDEETKNKLEELYTKVGEYELQGRRLYDKYRRLLSQYVYEYFPQFNKNRSLDILLDETEKFRGYKPELIKLKETASKLRILQEKGVEVLLGISKHDIYLDGSNYHSTGFSKRRASIEFEKDPSLIGAEEGVQRSFLRVWIIALPKDN